MLLRLTSPTGNILTINAVQIVVMSDDSTPVAYVANMGKQILYSDARDKDWAATVRGLGLKPPEVES